MKNVEKFAPILLILVSFGLMSFFAYTATSRSLTPVEAVILQIMSLLSGFGGSYLAGRKASSDAAKEIIKPHARSAFRRLIFLYRSISRVAHVIDSNQADSLKIAVIKAIVLEQISTADDAMEDWKDVVPESVEELQIKMRDQEQSGWKND